MISSTFCNFSSKIVIPKITKINRLTIHEPHPEKRGTAREVVVVTGGAGFLGSYVTEELLELGYSVRVLDDLTEGSLEWLPLNHPNLEFIHGTPTDLDALSR